MTEEKEKNYMRRLHCACVKLDRALESGTGRDPVSGLVFEAIRDYIKALPCVEAEADAALFVRGL